MRLLILPKITTDAQNERFFDTAASNVKRMWQERNLSQLETALSIQADFTQIWKTTHTASTLIYFTFLSFQNFLTAI